MTTSRPVFVEFLGGIPRALRGRPDVPADAVAIRYGKSGRTTQLAFVVACIIEVVVVHLIVTWEPARWTLFVLGVLGVVLAVAGVLSSVAYPHSLGPAGLRVRAGVLTDLRIPLHHIESIRWSPRNYNGGKAVEFVDGVLSLQSGYTSQVSVTLVEARPVLLNGSLTEAVHEVRFPADEQQDVDDAARWLASTNTDSTNTDST